MGYGKLRIGPMPGEQSLGRLDAVLLVVEEVSVVVAKRAVESPRLINRKDSICKAASTDQKINIITWMKGLPLQAALQPNPAFLQSSISTQEST